MLIQKTSISVAYKRIDGIKKAYLDNKGLLKDHFNEATVLPIPDDAPVEIPRIMIRTLHEHAQLNISPIAATFEIYYDGGYERDWKACVKYIKKRMEKVFTFLNILTKNDYEYIGLVSYIIYDEVKQDGIKKIADTLLNPKKINGIYDINIKYTFTENDNMFINIMLQNIRKFKEGTEPDKAGDLNKKNQIAESIGAVIDINDRYGFNNDPKYHSDSGKLTGILDSMSNVIEKKLCALIEDGEY